MSRAQVALRTATVLAVVLLALAAGYSALEMEEERRAAQEHYERTMAEVEQVNARLQQTERRLQRLTSSLEAVELEARYQLRMIKPGETLVLVRPEDE